jgi:uncharacterized protein (TIGR03089 family)
MTETLGDLFRSNRADPARPFMTFYDDATGERVELSRISFGNWVAKTANLIQADLAAAPGEIISILLPAHWQALVWLAACWETRLVAAPGLDPAKASHAVVDPDHLAAAGGSPGERIALPLLPLGGRFGEHGMDPLPPGLLDYAAEVPGHGDRFTSLSGPARPDDQALLLDARTYTQSELAARGRGRARELGLSSRARVLTDRKPTTMDGITDAFLAPLAVGGSTVLCRHLDRSRVDHRASAEMVSDILLTGLGDPGQPAG